MTKIIYVLAVGMFLSGCIINGSGKVKSAPPGQVKKATGYNPASGKVKR